MPQMQCLSGVLATFQRPGKHKAKRRVQSEIAAVFLRSPRNDKEKELNDAIFVLVQSIKASSMV